ncbi:MAG: ribonuclease HI [Chloroflexota bacterium]|nr:ribonuclease HI [Chloroflexota bacterium]
MENGPLGFQVFGDGACTGNPGPGGWAAIVVFPDGRREELSGHERRTTNNRMELIAVLQGLSLVPTGGSVLVTTDSQYVVKGASSWINGWKRKGWLTSTGSGVLNRDLWESIDAELDRLLVGWSWIRGHNGHPENERCDRLARRAATLAVRAGR